MPNFTLHKNGLEGHSFRQKESTAGLVLGAETRTSSRRGVRLGAGCFVLRLCPHILRTTLLSPFIGSNAGSQPWRDKLLPRGGHERRYQPSGGDRRAKPAYCANRCDSAADKGACRIAGACSAEFHGPGFRLGQSDVEAAARGQ